MKAICAAFLFVFIFLISCRKDSFITSSDARISLSADTLKYDTVFPTAGSVTQLFKIFNDNNQKLRLSSIKLAGGAASSFKMNVDGLSTAEATNIEIAANDSMYVFVQVNVNPSSANLPFVIRDSIEISYNGNTKKIQLEAWGQNAHFMRDKEISGNETWTNDLPYVVLGYLYVQPNAKLTIDKGCRIYVHPNAPIIIDGTLQINGQKDSIDRVYFQSDRLDNPYKDYPAGWPGIYFRQPSKDNSLQYAVLKNAYQAIAVEDPSVNANPKLVLNECIIDNAYDAGIIGLNTNIIARNCLISNCGKNISLGKGGTYQFIHCTVASFSNNFISHKNPVLTVADHDGAGNSAALNAVFRNCIFWGKDGTVENEVIVDKKGSNSFSVNFDSNLWKVKTAPANSTIIQAINDQDPLFDSIDVSRRYYNFRLKTNSPAINTGTNAGAIIDLDGNSRPNGLPDLGSYEKQ